MNSRTELCWLSHDRARVLWDADFLKARTLPNQPFGPPIVPPLGFWLTLIFFVVLGTEPGAFAQAQQVLYHQTKTILGVNLAQRGSQ
jgi:hypothetical protein